AEGRISLVITVDSPLDGARNLTNLYEAAAAGINPYRKESETWPEISLPGLKELEPDSSTIRALKSSPINDLSNTGFIRVYGKDDLTVEKVSALRRPPGNAGSFRQVIVRTTENSADHRAMRNLLVKYKNLLAHVLSNDYPLESEIKPIEVTDEY